MPKSVSTGGDLLAETEAADLTSTVSRNVRAYRKSHGWTIDQLADRANLGRVTVAEVEQGKDGPDMVTLARLANALGVNMGALLESERPASTRVVSAGSGFPVWTGQPGTVGSLLLASRGSDNAELWHNTIAAGDGLHSDPHPAGVREMLLVIEGDLVLEVAGVSYRLNCGDAATFRGDQPHAYINPTESITRYALVVVWPNHEALPDRDE
jgi:transcriptional regulator with XRE-family HTH domain